MASNRNQSRPPPIGEPSAKRFKPGEGAIITRLPLKALVPGCFDANAATTTYKGKIIGFTAFNNGTKLATIVLQSVDGDVGTKKIVQFKGQWAKDLCDALGKGWAGTLVSLSGKGALIKEHKGKEGEMRQYRVQYEKGVMGTAEKDGEKTALLFGSFAGGESRPAQPERVALASQSSSNPSSYPNPTPNPSAPNLVQDVVMTDLRNPVVASVSATKANETAGRSASSEAAAALPKAPVVAVHATEAFTKAPVSSEQAAKKEATEARFGQQAAQQAKAGVPQQEKGQGARALKHKKKAEAERQRWGLKTESTTYSSLAGLPTGTGQNVIALAAVKTPPGPAPKSKSNDWCTTLQLYDPSGASASEFFSATFFFPNETQLPHLEDGDVILLLKMNRTEGQKQLVGYKWQCSFAVFKAADLLGKTLRPKTSGGCKWPHAPYGPEEIEYATRIAEWQQREVSRIAFDENKDVDEGEKDTRSVAERSAEVWANRKSGRGRKMTVWEDCEADAFVDMIVEVIRTYENRRAVELYVSDYTENENGLIYEAQQANGTAQVAGQRQFQISLFDKQGEPARDPNFGPGKLVHLNNVRIKKDGNGFLVGTMVEDPKFPNKRDVTVIKSSNAQWATQIAALSARRLEYWAPQGGVQGVVAGQDSPVPVAPVFRQPPAAVATAALVPEKLNHGVACNVLEQTRVPMARVLDPHNNADGFWRLRGRIIDYLPARLEDWVRATCPDCDMILEPQLKTCLDHGNVKHDYAFHLSIEDAPTDDNPEPHEYIKITVAYEDALNVLPNLPATADMRTGADDLDQLRRRFSAVLGKIEERKRRKQDVNEEHVGDYFDFAISAIRRKGKYQYRFHGTYFP